MRIKVTQEMIDYEGNPAMSPKIEKGQPVFDENKLPVQETIQLRNYFINAINSKLEGEVLTAEDKARIYYLSVKLFRGKEVDLTQSDREFILERVDKVYDSPIIYGRIKDAFEGKQAEYTVNDEENVTA